MKTILAVVPVIVLCAAGIACHAQAVSGPKNVQITVYNANFALVKDTRAVTLNKGISSIEVEDVAAKIDPTSVLFKSITSPNSVAILEQNYQYDLISPENILNKSVGQPVFYSYYDGSGTLRTQSGILLNPPQNGGMVIKADDGNLILNPSGQVTLQKMPEGLHPRPTLNWMLRSDVSGPQDAEVSYITDGIGWKADYVALVNKDDTALDLAGWVTLDNQSGATYADAKLTLIAGDVRRIQPRAGRRGGFDVDSSMMLKAEEPQFVERAFFEYHMYSMERPTTIRDRETKQLSLLNATGASVKKELIYDGRGDWWRSWWYPGRTEYDPGAGYDTSNYHKVNVILEAKNSKENRMGMPLPAGKIRVYKLDQDGSQQFIGEDQIDHTPKDEKIRLYIGDAFDVVGDYKRTDYERISDHVVEESFEIEIRNHKETAVEVKAVNHVWATWKVLQTSHEYVKKDAHTIEFPVKVPADGKVTITYRIRTTW